MPFIADSWPDAITAVCGAERLRMFSGCNYLGLAQHPEVVAAAQAGLARHGIAANGSPLTTGRVTAHAQLEARLAAFLGQPKALLLPDGHLANVAVCQGLAKTDPALRCALIDEAAHDSLLAAARAAGLAVQRYRHNDAAHAAQLCREATDSSFVLSDSVFGASGELCEVDALLSALPHTATLLLDDSHGLGVLGPAGRGALAAWRERKPQAAPHARVVVTSSLSKGLGCYGGVLAADAAWVDIVQKHAGAYGGTTPTPPAIAEAALMALSILERDSSLVDRLRHNTERVRAALVELGQPVPATCVPIFSLALSLELSQRLQVQFEQAAIGVPLVNYANGPAQHYFRISISAQHSDADIDALLRALSAGLGLSLL